MCVRLRIQYSETDGDNNTYIVLVPGAFQCSPSDHRRDIIAEET